jgi:16S rRNA (guanine966-N2)-methyltransferase
MRVVAGLAKGRRLRVPAGRDIRPTADRVREALFNILRHDVAGARVLDLFCGSGAVAVEALSRGASTATLVDESAAAVATARDNLVASGFADRAHVVRSTAERWAAGPAAAAFDLVFLDPPYAMSLDSISSLIGRLVDGAHLAPQALVVVERGSDSEAPTFIGPLPLVDNRRYGTTRLLFASAAEGSTG